MADIAASSTTLLCAMCRNLNTLGILRWCRHTTGLHSSCLTSGTSRTLKSTITSASPPRLQGKCSPDSTLTLLKHHCLSSGMPGTLFPMTFLLTFHQRACQMNNSGICTSKSTLSAQKSIERWSLNSHLFPIQREGTHLHQKNSSL